MAEPIYKLKNGIHSVAVFENSYTDKDGKQQLFSTLNIQRAYKDKNGEWKHQTISDNPERAIVLAEMIKSTALWVISQNKEGSHNFTDNGVPF